MQAKDHLRTARKAAGLTQQLAAQRCKVSFAAWSAWERGINPMAPAMLVGCLILLGVNKADALAAFETLESQ